MFSNTALTAIIAITMTMTMSDAFTVVKRAVLNVAGVYESAQQIDPWNDPHKDYRYQQQALYKAAGRLEGLSQRVIQIEFDNRGRVVRGTI